MFRRIVFSAVAAGLLAGVLPTVVRRLQVVSAEAHPTLAPPELLRTFIVATAIANAAFRAARDAGSAIASRKLA